MSAVAASPAKLDIARVVRRVVDVLMRNWRALVRPALLYLYLPGVIVGLLRPDAGGVGEAAPSPLLPLVSLLTLIPYALFQGGLIRLTVADLGAEAISTDEAMRVGRRRMWALLGLLLLAGLGIFIGFLLLVLPGVIAALAWCVAAPVLIEERRPVMQTFGRSAELTRGSRLNIFAVGLVVLAAEIVAALVVGLVSLPFPRMLALALLWPAFQTVTEIVTGVTAATIYAELRDRRGGFEAPAAA
jgi:hypothetical protein